AILVTRRLTSEFNSSITQPPTQSEPRPTISPETSPTKGAPADDLALLRAEIGEIVAELRRHRIVIAGTPIPHTYGYDQPSTITIEATQKAANIPTPTEGLSLPIDTYPVAPVERRPRK